MSDEKLAWLDLETLGLAADDPIIEVGIIITDLDLNVQAEFSELCWEPSYTQAWENAPQIVRDMHSNSGLIARARARGLPRLRVEELARNFLLANDAQGLPMCGNSLGADKTWLMFQMPQLLDAFHYRVIDVSSLKEACRRYNPKVFAAAPEKGLAHTAIADLYESIAEFRHYLDNFIFDGRE